MPTSTLTARSSSVGEKILDQLQSERGVYPFVTSSEGMRGYALDDATGTASEVEANLDPIQPDWREHLARA